MSLNDFLAWEAQQPYKHEYWKGEVSAMTGARQAHVLVAGNCFAALKAHLRGGPCRTYIADMQLAVDEADAVFYPDVFVSCHPDDLQAERVLHYPKVIIEVLSDSTAAYDRGAKFAAYRKLTDLQEYLIVDIAQRRLELYRRAADHWLMFDSAGSGPALQLQSVDMALSPAEAFEDLDEQT